jgi:hypothetical protein
MSATTLLCLLFLVGVIGHAIWVSRDRIYRFLKRVEKRVLRWLIDLFQ